MTKRLRRSEEFSVQLEISKDEFIRPPSDAQRNAILKQAMEEFCRDLYCLDDLAKRFVRGTPEFSLDDRTHKELADDEIVEDWQIPMMRKMAGIACDSGGDVLEIGFGLGIASTMIQENGVRSHTIIECNESIMKRYDSWRENYPERDIRLVPGTWQETIDNTGQFDAIFFHTYPLNQDEYMEYVVGKATFAEHFFDAAAAHLNDGGVFTYFTNEIDSLSRGHQRALFKRFRSITQTVVGLEMKDGVRDSWWADSMVVVKAVK